MAQRLVARRLPFGIAAIVLLVLVGSLAFAQGRRDLLGKVLAEDAPSP